MHKILLTSNIVIGMGIWTPNLIKVCLIGICYMGKKAIRNAFVYIIRCSDQLTHISTNMEIINPLVYQQKVPLESKQNVSLELTSKKNWWHLKGFQPKTKGGTREQIKISLTLTTSLTLEVAILNANALSLASCNLGHYLLFSLCSLCFF